MSVILRHDDLFDVVVLVLAAVTVLEDGPGGHGPDDLVTVRASIWELGGDVANEAQPLLVCGRCGPGAEDTVVGLAVDDVLDALELLDIFLVIALEIREMLGVPASLFAEALDRERFDLLLSEGGEIHVDPRV